MKKLAMLALVLGAPFFGGCQCGGESDPPPEEQPHTDPPPQTTTTNEAPVIAPVDVPSFPPIGRSTVLSTVITDDRNLGTASVDFRNYHEYKLLGTQKTIKFTGLDLGEGFGTAVITATDTQGAWSQRVLEGIAVDLSPPDVKLLDSVVQHGQGSDVWLWVGDAFVLGSVTVTAGAASDTYSFEEGYPETFGSEWDESLVSFPSTMFQEGSETLHVVVKDAAGNSVEKDFDLFLDGTAPGVKVTSPAPNAVVSGTFKVHATAADESGGPVWIALALGGAPMGTFAGPDAEVGIDTSSFAAGEVVLTATAIDEAGNESASVEIPVVVQ